MIKTKYFTGYGQTFPDAQPLDVQINYFLSTNSIDEDRLIDIKYQNTFIGEYDTLPTALVIYKA